MTLPKLLPDYQIIAWDPPNQGKSYPPEKPLALNFLEVNADIAHELMNKLGVAKYSMLGWSHGGVTAMIISAKHPECIEKLAVFGTLAYMTHHEMKTYDYTADVRNWADYIRKPKENLYGFEYLQRKYLENVEAVKRIYKEKEGNLCIDFLKDIKAQTLILQGNKDAMVSNEHGPYLNKNIAGSKLINFPNGFHDIHIQFVDEFNKHVVDFFKN